MIKKYWLGLFVVALGCSQNGKYDVNKYYDLKQQDQIMTGIVTYLLDAPPQAKLEDRFDPKYRNFYSFRSAQFSFEKYFPAANGRHYFYVIRPAANPNEKRGVGGHFMMDKNFNITSFREEFVTPALPIEDVKGRCSFLFEEMVNGKLETYLKMPTYVQWPNEASYYDTVTYEWKLKPEYESN